MSKLRSSSFMQTTQKPCKTKGWAYARPIFTLIFSFISLACVVKNIGLSKFYIQAVEKSQVLRYHSLCHSGKSGKIVGNLSHNAALFPLYLSRSLCCSTNADQISFLSLSFFLPFPSSY